MSETIVIVLFAVFSLTMIVSFIDLIVFCVKLFKAFTGIGRSEKIPQQDPICREDEIKRNYKKEQLSMNVYAFLATVFIGLSATSLAILLKTEAEEASWLWVSPITGLTAFFTGMVFYFVKSSGEAASRMTKYEDKHDFLT